MKIASYNVNSISQRLSIVLDWLAEHKPDVLCLQERTGGVNVVSMEIRDRRK